MRSSAWAWLIRFITSTQLERVYSPFVRYLISYHVKSCVFLFFSHLLLDFPSVFMPLYISDSHKVALVSIRFNLHVIT